MTENVVVVTGADPRSVVDTLQALDAEGALELRAAAVVRRDADGRLSLDHEAGDAVSFADRHPRLGAVITLLLGPFDTLLFGNQLVSLFGATERSAGARRTTPRWASRRACSSAAAGASVRPASNLPCRISRRSTDRLPMVAAACIDAISGSRASSISEVEPVDHPRLEFPALRLHHRGQRDHQIAGGRGRVT